MRPHTLAQNKRAKVCGLIISFQYATILSYGEHIEVLEPEHIRKICAEKAKIFLDRHE